MTNETLQRGARLAKQIEILRSGHQRLYSVPNEPDGGYNIFLSKYRDGSGWKADLSGACIGDELREVVIDFLEKKIAALEAEFAAL